MISLIDRYISKIFVAYFFAALIVICTLFLSIDFLGNISKFDVETAILTKYTFYYLPNIIVQISPIAVIIATVFTLSSLNKTNELVALFSSGLSLARISAPILIWTALICISSFYIKDRVVPVLEKKRNLIYYVDLKKQPGLYSMVKTNKIWYRSGKMLFNIQYLNTKEKKAEGLSFYFFDNSWNLLQVLEASTADITGNQWLLKNGQLSLFQKDSSFPLRTRFEEKSISMKEALGDLQQSASSVDIMPSSELRKYIKRNKAAGINTLEIEVGYYAKFAFSFASLVLCLIGIPFSLADRRSGGMGRNIGICIMFVFAYWALYSTGMSLARHGSIAPIVGVWASNFVFFILAIYFILRTRK